MSRKIPWLDDRACITCSAFAPNPKAPPKAGEAQQGWCHAAPPTAVPFTAQTLQGSQTGVMGAWPTTDSTQWCRAWAPMEPVDAKQ